MFASGTFLPFFSENHVLDISGVFWVSRGFVICQFSCFHLATATLPDQTATISDEKATLPNQFWHDFLQSQSISPATAFFFPGTPEMTAFWSND